MKNQPGHWTHPFLSSPMGWVSGHIHLSHFSFAAINKSSTYLVKWVIPWFITATQEVRLNYKSGRNAMNCSKLCPCLDPQTIFLKFYSTDQSPKHLWIHFYEHGGLPERERNNPKSCDYSISGPCIHRMEPHQLLYCNLFSTLPPSCWELWSIALGILF